MAARDAAQQTMTVPDLRQSLRDHFHPTPPKRLAVAVSGGSDSTALLMLLADWARDGGPEIHAVTVDHQLRKGSAADARVVHALCTGCDTPHDTLIWQGWDGRGNLSDAARRARYGLMADWAAARGIDDLLLGHTADDQAETLLMRLARQAGLDGLAGMAARRPEGPVTLHRPLLSVTREDLRDMLRARAVGWIDDPTNDDPAHARVRTRAALAALHPAGITAEGLSQVAAHLAEARRTIASFAAAAAARIATLDAGDILFETTGWHDLPPDLQRRLMQAALRWISGAPYGARGRAIEDALAQLSTGRGVTLHGCRITVNTHVIRITREYRVVACLRADADQTWDQRWRMIAPQGMAETAGLEVRALGADGLLQCPDRKTTRRPAASLRASPAIWQGTQLICAPLAGFSADWTAETLRSRQDFVDLLLSH